jgi:hypothetical protein
MERSEIIEILDEGNEGPVIGPEASCCALAFGFFRRF